MRKNKKLELKPINESISRKKLLRGTDKGRTYRGKFQIKRSRTSAVEEINKTTERIEYITKAKPSVEKKTHHGYVTYDINTNEIHEMFCDCSDFFYRLYAPMVKVDLATWDITPKMRKCLIKKHNKEWTKKTNKSGKIFVCKHLYKIIDKYI